MVPMVPSPLLTAALVTPADDVMMMAFLPNFGRGQDLTQRQNIVNLAFHSPSATQADILLCQQTGKPIILSIGGGAGNYGFDRCIATEHGD